MANNICGVDVSKARLDAWFGCDGTFAQFENSADGIAGLAGACRARAVELVAMEATGGFERLPFLLLWESGLPCAIANPRSVRRYAEAMGILEKTDKIDAGVIVRFAQAIDMKPDPVPTAAQQRLKALVARLKQVTGDLTVQKQRRSAATDEMALESLGEVIALLKRQSKKLEGEIGSMIHDDPLWSKLDETFRTIKGVADRTVARLMADLPEIGTRSGKAISKLVGLAPLANDSGKSSRKRHIRAGRASVRSILYLVADIAAKYDQSLAAFKTRLLQAGKPKMVARVALAHKLLVRLNAKAHETREKFGSAT